VTKTLEELRKRGEIGHSLEAAVRLAASGPLADVLAARRALLPEICIVSRVELVAAGAVEATSAVPGLGVAARRIEGTKCARCWNYRPDVGERREHPALCGRCASVVTAGDVPAAAS
jgi:isoleucyl-tRNA synthetase